MLGEPWYVIDEWNVEVYYREEGAIAIPIPVPHMSVHYLLVAYRDSGVVNAVESFRDWGRDYNVQKRVDGYLFDRSDWRLRLWREGEKSSEEPKPWEEQRLMYPCLFSSELKVRKEYVELPDVKLYPTPESTKPVEQQRKKQRAERDSFTQKIFGYTENRAKNGDPEAQLELYRVRRDPREKLKWLCRAADQGQHHAQKELADLYREGCGVINQDATRAYMWLSLAIQGGAVEYRSNLDAVIKTMSKGQLLEAEHMLSKWEPGQCARYLIPIGSVN